MQMVLAGLVRHLPVPALIADAGDDPVGGF